MSGSAGGNRIQRQMVQKTVEVYIDTVLSKYPGFKEAKISGSYNLGTKSDFGDIDLVITVEGTEKKEVKEQLVRFLEKYPDDVIVPFKSERYRGKKSLSSGELVTILFPVPGTEEEYVQVDNIISLSEEESTFKKSFLDVPAEKQGLLLGLTKVVLLEEDINQVTSRLGIGGLEKLGEGEEYEFSLSGSGLSLRKVELDPEYREVSRVEVWRSTNWQNVEKLLKNYPIEESFEKLLDFVAKNITSTRSRNRIKGTFKAMITVKSGEQGTPKGMGKEKAREKIEKLLKEQLEATVAIYGGGFKPPHKAHFENAKFLASQAQKLIIFIGPITREGGVNVTAEQSKKIWEIYIKYLPVHCTVIISEYTPILDTYKWVEMFGQRYGKVITGTIKKDMKRFKSFIEKRDKYPNVEILELPIMDDEEGKISATKIRLSMKEVKKGTWIPKELSKEDRKQVIKILDTEEENFKDGISEAVEKSLSHIKLVEGSSGTAIAPHSGIRSEDRHKLGKTYESVKKLLGTEEYTIDFNQDFIKITLKQEGERVGFDYTPYMASILESMVEEGTKIEPLPEIYLNQEVDEDIFRKTGSYDPEEKAIHLYSEGRHPKDVLRSFAHEMIHHKQNLEGRFNTKIETTNINEDAELQKIEEEAYLEGNILFRKWEDKAKSRKKTEVI